MSKSREKCREMGRGLMSECTSLNSDSKQDKIDPVRRGAGQDGATGACFQAPSARVGAVSMWGRSHLSTGMTKAPRPWRTPTHHTQSRFSVRRGYEAGLFSYGIFKVRPSIRAAEKKTVIVAHGHPQPRMCHRCVAGLSERSGLFS
ncbi:hypothetical protein EVAR_78949_1 [Eumeta japonica]|uniref:Uncharacterized protein n=1 Tax=Eumeta variegata TaxID=151549 RepID=A0A4C1U2U0_EUMVA|nr:hypothetical protein EVAR_78949_1 [Eumeta japonica]